MDQDLRRTCNCFLLVFGFYVTMCSTALLRGNKGFMIEVQGLIQHGSQEVHEDPELQHVVIPLLGEFKGERREHWHLQLTSAESASGFKLKI
eukprot:12967759-Ditylum_brightwellii.AAC.1